MQTADGRRTRWSHAALLWLGTATLYAQAAPTIRVPVRLVSVPTLVLGADGHTLVNLGPGDFRLFDDDRPQAFTVDSSVAPLSLVLAIQANSNMRDYLPFVAKVGSTLDALLIGATGESAVLFYGDEVTLAKPFDAGDVSAALRTLTPGGTHARAIDAGVRGLAMLRQRPASRTRVLLFIGQPGDSGSDYALDDARRDAGLEDVTVHAFALPVAGKSFVGDTFSIRGLSSANILERGGFKASVNLSRLVPVLARGSAAAAGADPFSVLTGVTGGTELHFRKQAQLEDAIAILGLELRSLYTLSFRPLGEPGYHTLRVESTAAGAKTHARPGYWMAGN